MSQESRGNSQYLKTTILLANVVMSITFTLFTQYLSRDRCDILQDPSETGCYGSVFIPKNGT